MLTELSINNFKAWKSTGNLRLAPLTIIFGANSAGKSSLGHLLLALKQTSLITDRKRALHLGDQNSLIDLGTFIDCLHGHNKDLALEFSVEWRLPTGLTIYDPLRPTTRYMGNSMRLSASIIADSKELPELNSFEYELFDDEVSRLLVRHGVNKHGKSEVEATPLRLVKATGRAWALERPEKFYRFSDVTLARYQNASFLQRFSLQAELMFEGISYLGPLRDYPKRTYSWAGDTVTDVGAEGQYAIAALLGAAQEDRRLNRRHRQHTYRFDSFIADWLRELGVIESFEVSQVAPGRKDYEVLVRTHVGAPQVKLTDVGFGVSQLLPALVQAFYAPPWSTVWMEQPEIHLHPQVQAKLADVFISAVQSYEGGKKRNAQLIIESHSEHLLLRLQRRIAEGVIPASDVAVYFAHHGDQSAEIEPLELNDFGEIANWPTNFFGDEMTEIAERVKAGMASRSRQGAK